MTYFPSYSAPKVYQPLQFGWSITKPPEPFEFGLRNDDFVSHQKLTLKESVLEQMADCLIRPEGDPNAIRKAGAVFIPNTREVCETIGRGWRFEDDLTIELGKRLQKAYGGQETPHYISERCLADRHYNSTYTKGVETLHTDMPGDVLLFSLLYRIKNIKGIFPLLADARHLLETHGLMHLVTKPTGSLKTMLEEVSDDASLIEQVSEHTMTLEDPVFEDPEEMPLVLFNNHHLLGIRHGATPATFVGVEPARFIRRLWYGTKHLDPHCSETPNDQEKSMIPTGAASRYERRYF